MRHPTPNYDCSISYRRLFYVCFYNHFVQPGLGGTLRTTAAVEIPFLPPFPTLPQFCHHRVIFTDTPSGEEFRLSLGIGQIASLAQHASITSSPEDWTLGQRQKLIRSAIRGWSALVPADDEEADGRSHPDPERYILDLPSTAIMTGRFTVCKPT